MTVVSGNGRIAENVPPYDAEAEKSVIGAILLTPALLESLCTIIGPDDFYDSANAVVYLAACDCWEAGEPVEAVTVAERLEANRKLADAGGVDGIRDYMDAVGNIKDAKHYAGIIAEKAKRRRKCDSAWEMAQKAPVAATAVEELSTLSERLPSSDSTRRHAGAIVKRLADVQPEPVQWLWPDRIPLGKLTLIAGDPGLGKSFLTLEIAARVSTGRGWPDCYDKAQPAGSVILFSAEDDIADTIRPRLDKAGADVERIVAVEGVGTFDSEANRKRTRSFSLERDLPELDRVIAKTKDTRLVVIDPISAYCGKVDSHKNTDVRGLLAPLAALAGKYNVAIVAVTHLSKGSGGKAVYRAMGSLAYIAAARAGWLVAKDSDNPSRRLLLPVKMNIAEEPTGLAFAVVQGVIAWEADPVDLSGDDALSAELDPPQHDNRQTERAEAKDWLLEQLGNCSVLSKQIKRWATDNGISSATLRRAKDDLRVQSKRVGFGPESRVYWTLNSP